MPFKLFCRPFLLLLEPIAQLLCFLSFALTQNYALMVSFVESDELETFFVMRDRSAITIVFK
ncbi:hypothetical protein PMIT1303_01478 [Prochlorococcus sp. MIT 1303]|nr:hypothetical protein PMIT1303_01478 [Prochlorococcus sp. MIT 1303]